MNRTHKTDSQEYIEGVKSMDTSGVSPSLLYSLLQLLLHFVFIKQLYGTIVHLHYVYVMYRTPHD